MRTSARYVTAVAGLGLAVVLGVGLAGPARGNLVGAPIVIDGDTLEVAGRRIDLWGVDAPELDQTCRLEDQRTYRCGEIARAALLDLTAGTRISCEPVSEGADGVIVAVCEADGFSLNRNMVYTGWALADRTVSERFVPVEEGARTARRGLWRGAFETPWQWRAARR